MRFIDCRCSLPRCLCRLKSGALHVWQLLVAVVWSGGPGSNGELPHVNLVLVGLAVLLVNLAWRWVKEVVVVVVMTGADGWAVVAVAHVICRDGGGSAVWPGSGSVRTSPCLLFLKAQGVTLLPCFCSCDRTVLQGHRLSLHSSIRAHHDNLPTTHHKNLRRVTRLMLNVA